MGMVSSITINFDRDKRQAHWSLSYRLSFLSWDLRAVMSAQEVGAKSSQPALIRMGCHANSGRAFSLVLWAGWGRGCAIRGMRSDSSLCHGAEVVELRFEDVDRNPSTHRHRHRHARLQAKRSTAHVLVSCIDDVQARARHAGQQPVGRGELGHVEGSASETGRRMSKCRSTACGRFRGWIDRSRRPLFGDWECVWWSDESVVVVPVSIGRIHNMMCISALRNEQQRRSLGPIPIA